MCKFHGQTLRLSKIIDKSGSNPDATYATQLQAQYRLRNLDHNTVVDPDPITPLVMDNNYYKNGFVNKVSFCSDIAFFQDFKTQFTSNLNDFDGMW